MSSAEAAPNLSKNTLRFLRENIPPNQMSPEQFALVEPLLAPHFAYLQPLISYLEGRHERALRKNQTEIALKWQEVLNQFQDRLNLSPSQLQRIQQMSSWRELLGMYQRAKYPPSEIRSPESLMSMVAALAYGIFEKETQGQSFQAVNDKVKTGVAAVIERERVRRENERVSPEVAMKEFQALLQSWQDDYWKMTQA